MKNLREWLVYLAITERLQSFKPNVDLEFEVLACLQKYEGRKACFFPSPSNHSVSLVGGILGQRQWVAEALGIESENLLSHFKKAIHNPIPWQVVNQEQAPVQQVVHSKDIDIKKLLPIATHHEKDVGPYITSGLVHGLNLATGKQNTSINRMQVHAPDKLGILMLPRDLNAYFQFTESQNKPLPVTITIGHDPITKMASQAIAERDCQEMQIAGALLGRPLSMVKSMTNEVMIPSEAEIAIEGYIIPNYRALEGPFGEFPKYYSGAGLLPVIQVTAITHRQNPIYETNNPSGAENVVLGGIPREASLLERLQVNFPNVLDLRLTPGGLGRYHIVIKMRKKQMGEGKNVLAATFGCHYDIKHAIVVDDDIDIDDANDIEWAIATRFQVDKDLVVIDRALGSMLDPSTKKRGLSSKIGFDATTYVDKQEEFYVSKIPASKAVLHDSLAVDDLNAFWDNVK